MAVSKDLDLNLLKVLSMLLEVQSTKKAAERLDLSQPAVSRALGRLREHFSDELFIREAHGLKPTSKAQELAVQLPAAMSMLNNVVSGKPVFEPSQYSGKLSIAVNGFIAQWLAPALIVSINQQAPNVELHILNWEHSSSALLNDGKIHLGINYSPYHLSSHFTQQTIGSDEFVFICRKDHPLKQDTIFIEDFSRYDIASFLIPNWNEDGAIVAQILRRYGIDARVPLRTNQLSILLEAVKHSDMVSPCSRYTAEKLGSEFRTLKIDPKLTVPYSDIASIMAHTHCNHPLHIWLHQQVIDCIAQITSARK
ncbi:LysR family transcriptional regulator [Shewanella waksmanii]|uniref:LysR family transcriptional regulator n=1 Tax=Shewanella waksmanii TaxID=213783 RepID=UPI00055AA692|nr:LysR family transcriptional regulator [Shewanella waksmanii]